MYWPTVFPGAYSGCGTVITERSSLEADDEPTAIQVYQRTDGLLISGVRVPSTRWVHVAVVYRAASRTGELYVDGVLRGTGSSAATDSLSMLRLGGGLCEVVIDDVFVFDRAITADEVTTLFAL
jgi:hypothetical protein